MIKRLLSIFVGIFFIILGFIGFLLPLTPGWAFIFIGILFISPHHGKKAVARIKELLFRIFKKKER